MLNLYGSYYVIEHCCAERDKELERKALEYYVTDTLHLIGMNAAVISRGKYLASSWRELCECNVNSKDTKDGDEIAISVIEKAGLLFGGD